MIDHIPVQEWRVTPVVLPKQDTKWRFALGARPESQGVVVELCVRNGRTGLGYASDIPHLGYSFDWILQEIHELTAALEVVSVWDRGPQLAAVRAETSCNPAVAAVEMAVLDATAKALGRPLVDLLGGRFRSSVPVMRILSLKNPEEMAAIARRHVEEGYRHIKIKVDNEVPGLDGARVTAIREAVGPDVHLTLDANQSYDAHGAIALYESVCDLQIDVFEQPVGANDLDGLREVTHALDCTVEADESASSVARVWELLRTGACSGVSLKVLKLGGLTATLEAARLCALAGVHCRLGAHVGSRLLSAAALAAAAAIENIDYACELGEFARLQDDPFAGLEVKDGHVFLSPSIGVGVQPAH